MIFRRTALILLMISFAFFAIYLSFPSPEFSISPPDAVQSLEEADTETPFRRAYFTNFSREQVVEHYQKQLSPDFFGLVFPTYRLNYPPENAYTLIRDQTRSTFLEEIVHPFRESIFVNGFKPKEAKDDIWYKGTHYEQKITVKYIASPVFVRIPLVLAGLFVLYFLLRELTFALKEIWKNYLGD